MAEVERRYRGASEGTERSHWQIIWLLAPGQPAYEVAAMTSYSAYGMGQMAPRLNDAGEEGLVNPRTQSRPNRHRLLTDAQLGELDTWQLNRCLALQTD